MPSELFRPDEINIKDLVTERPTPPESPLPIDLDKEITPDEWEEMLSCVDTHNLAAWQSGESTLTTAASLTVAFPERRAQIIPNEIALADLKRIVLEVPNVTPIVSTSMVWLTEAEDLKQLVPDMKIEGIADNDQIWQGLVSTWVTNHENATHSQLVRNGAICCMLWPEKREQLRSIFSQSTMEIRDTSGQVHIISGLELAKTELAGDLEFSRRQQDRYARADSIFLPYFAHVRIFLPEAYAQYPLTKQDWQTLHEKFTATKEAREWEKLAVMCKYIRILMAESIEFTDEGLKLVMPTTFTGSAPTELPEQRKF